jgi:hypothetical protein
MRRALLAACLALVFIVAPHAEPTRARDLDLHLVLAIDSSSSVDMDEYYLQLGGYAKAFAHPDLWEAIRRGNLGAIAVTLFEWSGPRQQVVNFEWRILDSPDALRAFAAELAIAPRFVIGGETAIGDAVMFALALLDGAPGQARRAVIDVSGDGPSNRGLAIAAARAAAVARGVTINGLAVVNEEPELDTYYRDEVICGEGSFVLAARDYADFADAILKKLVREIRMLASAAE